MIRTLRSRRSAARGAPPFIWISPMPSPCSTNAPRPWKVLAKPARLWPSFWEARFLLGVELAVNEKLGMAQAEFEAVNRLRPNFARNYLNLAGGPWQNKDERTKRESTSAKPWGLTPTTRKRSNI